MPALTFDRLAAMTGGVVVSGGEIVCDSIVIDNREAKPGSVFFALRGDKHDGHSFFAQALEVAAGAVVSTVPEALPAGKGIVHVDDTTAALQRLASAVRREFSFTLVGVTGSAGKTTTKEMIATLAESEKRTWKSWGNFNNHIGFPLCLANTPEGTDVVVSEMGMSAKGEIEFLAKLAHPNVGVNFDPANMILYGMGDPVAALRRLAKHVVQIHIKDALPTKTPGTWGSEVTAGTGAVDWPAFFSAVRALPKTVDLVVEREAGAAREGDAAVAAQLVRGAFPGVRCQ